MEKIDQVNNDNSNHRSQEKENVMTEKTPISTIKEKVEKRSNRPYPAHTLEDALCVARAIQDNNAGKPMKRLLLAEAVGRTPGSSEYRLLLSSSFKYGLTTGNEKSEYIEMTPLGISIIKPTSDQERQTSYNKATLNPEFFKRVYDHYNENKLPSETFLKNTIEREFGLSREWLDDFLKIFIANGRSSGIIRDISGSPYVMIDAINHISVDQTKQDQKSEDKTSQTSTGETKKDTPPEDNVDNKQNEQDFEKFQSQDNTLKPRIFISHSNNQEIVEQIKTMLELADIEYEIAEEEESAAIPVTEKVLSAMRRCNAAVICVTADEKEKREDRTQGINQNVLIEIGAAFVLYDKKVVLVWDKVVAIPSNLQGLYRCEFSGNELSWTTGMKLMKAVSKFKGKSNEN